MSKPLIITAGQVQMIRNVIAELDAGTHWERALGMRLENVICTAEETAVSLPANVLTVRKAMTVERGGLECVGFVLQNQQDPGEVVVVAHARVTAMDQGEAKKFLHVEVER